MPPITALQSSSQQYLRPSSSQPQLRLASPSSGSSTPTLTALHLPKNEPKSLTGKLRHAFDKPKTADFGVKVMVYSMGDIPQNQGVFVVAWKFNGRPPHGRAGDLKPKSSMPDIKIQQPSSTSTAAAGSTVSLSTNSSVASSPESRYPSSLSITSVITPPGSLPPSPRAIKKPTDPTPLRHSTGPEIIDTPFSTSPASSAAELSPPAAISSEAPRTRKDSGTSEKTENTSSPASSRFPAGLDNVYPSATPAIRQPSSTSSKLSSTMTASVPFPRFNSSLPPMRSGTIPSPAVLLNCNPNDDFSAMRPPTITRTSSSISLSSESIAPAPKSRSRMFSTPASHKESTPTSSNARKGETPSRKVVSHACEYKYNIQHTIRIPLGKSVAASGASTPGKQEKAPLLGNGPLSESGLSIHVYEIQTQFTNSTARPTDHGESTAVVAHDRHIAKHHPDRNASDPKDKKEKGEKVLYGYINIDLAPFAGKGEVTRSYLLMGSKTNANLRVTVEMTQVGGDTFFAAPPLSEGHHVTGIHDLIGEENQAINRDLALARNSSNSSTGSSLSGAHTAQSRSVTSLCLPQNRSVSQTQPKSQYQSYEHHLKPPSEATKRYTSKFGMATIPRKASKEVLVTPPESPDQPTNDNHNPASHTLPKHHHKHHHHSVHIRHPYQRGYSQGFRGINELSPEAIIEAVFNPRPAAEEGPMTYVPGPGGWGISGGLQHEEEVIRDIGEKEVGKNVEAGEGHEGEKTGKMWARMKQRAYSKGVKEKREKEPSMVTA